MKTVILADIESVGIITPPLHSSYIQKPSLIRLTDLKSLTAIKHQKIISDLIYDPPSVLEIRFLQIVNLFPSQKSRR